MNRIFQYLKMCVGAAGLLFTSCHYDDPGTYHVDHQIISHQIHSSWNERAGFYNRIMAGRILRISDCLHKGDTASAEEYIRLYRMEIDDYHQALSVGNSWVCRYPTYSDIGNLTCRCIAPDTYSVQLDTLEVDFRQEYMSLTLQRTTETEYSVSGEGQLAAAQRDAEWNGSSKTPIYDSGVVIRFILNDCKLKYDSTQEYIFTSLDVYNAELTAVNVKTGEEVEVTIENSKVKE